jgi:nucleotidyltransferase substrate binding protein (TIGR01987 family)
LSVSTQELEKALNSLEKALNEPLTDIVRDATIQRFEFCVELSWKTARKLMGTSAVAPRVVIREMAAQGLIDDPEEWFVFLLARNESSHTYKEDIAKKVYDVASQFHPQGKALLARLKKL